MSCVLDSSGFICATVAAALPSALDFMNCLRLNKIETPFMVLSELLRHKINQYIKYVKDVFSLKHFFSISP